MLLRSSAVAAAVLLTAVASSCGSSKSPSVVRTGGGGVNSVPATTSAASSPASNGPTGKTKQTASVTPSTGLHDHQKVNVSASGFTPGEPLQVIQCADKGTSTGPADCNISGMASVSSDANGKVETQLEVLKGPFGSNNIVCGAQQKCLISVTQASLTPTEEADVPITFAG